VVLEAAAFWSAVVLLGVLAVVEAAFWSAVVLEVVLLAVLDAAF
jgi:hypothetical protein